MPLPDAFRWGRERAPLYCQAKTQRNFRCRNIVGYRRAVRPLPGLIPDDKLSPELRPPEFVCEAHVPKGVAGYYRISSGDRERIRRGNARG